MFGKLAWFVFGFAAGAVALVLLKKSEENEELDFESIADELTLRFSTLETESN